jgi:hypothetical protein
MHKNKDGENPQKDILTGRSNKIKRRNKKRLGAIVLFENVLL